LIVLALIALIAYSAMQGQSYRVQVCMAFNGRTACKTVRAKSEEGALRAGAGNACADIASGVTDSMRCEQAPPQSVKWLSRPEK
jgi:hypothetical protein